MSHLQKGEQLMNKWINVNQILLVSSTIPYHFEIWEGFSTEIRFTQGVEAPETARVRGPVPPVAGPSSQGVKLHRWYSSFVISQLWVS